MKKSEQYKVAQLAMLEYFGIAPEAKLEVLETLRFSEKIERTLEERRPEKEREEA